MYSMCLMLGTALNSLAECWLGLKSRHWPDSTTLVTLRIVRFLWLATRRYSGQCNLIWFSRQLSQVNIFRYWYLGQLKGIIPDIGNDRWGVPYTLHTGMLVGTGPEQSGVGVISRYFKPTWEIAWASTTSKWGSLHARSCKMLHTRCPIIWSIKLNQYKSHKYSTPWPIQKSCDMYNNQSLR